MLIALVVLAVLNLLVSGAILQALSHLGLRHLETADKVDRIHAVSRAMAAKVNPAHGPTGPVR